MVTKAVIEEIITQYSFKVRIPIFDRASFSASFTPNEELSIATVCTLPGFIPGYTVGDVVFVTFEDNDNGKPIILGKLYYDEKQLASISKINIAQIIVENKAELPGNTSIGSITPLNIAMLADLSTNISQRFSELNAKFDS